MSTKNSQTVAERIKSRTDDLTRAERQIADCLLENYPLLGLGSITHIAETAQVSTPSVVRFAKKLGFSGFAELQTDIRSEAEETAFGPISKHDRWADDLPDTHILNRFADAAADNLLQTLRQIDHVSFDQAIDLLADPGRNVYVVGGRITRALADYLFTHLQVIRNGVTLVASNSNTWPHFVLNMKKGDVLITFDIRRYERDILRLAEIAKDRGVELILFTDQWGSPAVRHSSLCFRSRIEVPSAWDSSVVPMFIVETMISALQDRLWEETRDRLDTLESLFDRTKLFRKFS